MAILLVYTDYKPKSHNLLRLNGRIVELDSRFGEAFPCRTKDEIEMLKRLSDAYIESRYKKNYTISRSELDYLESCVRKLQRLAEEVCKEYIKDFSTQVAEIPEDLQEKIAQMDNGIMQFYEARQNAMIENKKVLDEVRHEGVAEGLVKGKTEGIIEGKKEGKLEEKKEIARKMLAKDPDLDTISEMTDLPLEEIEKLNR